jgi:hypothetical protein
MALTDILLTVLILLTIFVLAYCKYMNKTLLELVQEVREIFKKPQEEVVDLY